MVKKFLVCLMLVGLGGLTRSPAQTVGTANYRFAEPNELTILVNLLGAVTRPGRYEISRTIDLPNLLSLAGGGVENADLSSVRITRAVKSGARAERKELTVNIEDLTKTTELDLLLFNEDFVYVPRTAGFTWQEGLAYVTSFALLTLAILSIINELK